MKPISAAVVTFHEQFPGILSINRAEKLRPEMAWFAMPRMLCRWVLPEELSEQDQKVVKDFNEVLNCIYMSRHRQVHGCWVHCCNCLERCFANTSSGFTKRHAWRAGHLFLEVAMV
jgi:hypothetical protein